MSAGQRPSSREGRAKYDAARRKARREQAARDEALVILARLYWPGIDDEPPLSTILYDRYGGAWCTGERKGDGWREVDGARDYALKWSSPAMADLGPFVGPRKRDPEVLAGMKRRAAEHRWHPERQQAHGPLPDPGTVTGRRTISAATTSPRVD